MLPGWGLKEGPLFLPYPCIIPAEPIHPDYLPHPSPLEVGTVLHYTLKTPSQEKTKRLQHAPALHKLRCSPPEVLAAPLGAHGQVALPCQLCSVLNSAYSKA